MQPHVVADERVDLGQKTAPRLTEVQRLSRFRELSAPPFGNLVYKHLMATPFRHLVVLMLENRSFDHMLGLLKSGTYDIDGLDGTETNPSAVGGAPPVPVTPDARTVHDLNPDPGHEFLNVNVQIFGNAAGTPAGPPMQGFVQDYALVSNEAGHGANIMKCFTEATLP